MEASPCTVVVKTVVIKVKYGGVLRRFNASILYERLSLSMDDLREKIISLFSFAHKTDLMLTYVDEDGDKVALVDDDDLHDAVKQGLNPLRVTVKVKDDNNGNQNYSNASSTPSSMKSPHVQHLPNPSAGISVFLKEVPEPLKLSDGLADKTSLSSQSVSELVDNLSKVCSSLGQQLSESEVTFYMPIDVPESSLAAENNASEPFKVDPTSKLQKVKPAENMERKEVKTQNVTGKKQGPSSDSHVVASALESENVDPSKPASVGVANCSGRKEKVKKTVECSNRNSHSWRIAKFPLSSPNLPSQVDNKLNDDSYTKNGDLGIDRTASGLRDETPHKEGPSSDSHVVASTLESENVNPSKPASVGVANCSHRKEKVKKTVECSNGKSHSWRIAEFPVSSANLPAQVDNKLNDGSYTKNGDLGIDRTASGLRDETPHKEGPSSDSHVVASALESENVDPSKPASVGVANCSGRKEKVKKTVECSNRNSHSWRIAEFPVSSANLPSQVDNKLNAGSYTKSGDLGIDRTASGLRDETPYKEGPSFDSHVVVSALETENVDPSKPASVGVANCSPKKEKVKKTVECSNGKSHSWRVAEFPVSSANLPSQVDNKLNDGSYTKNGDHGIDRTASGLRDETPYNGGLDFGPPHCASDVDPSRRINSQNDSSWSIVHHEICCDGCDTHPIVGPRFKSKVKVNYDLCNACFQKMGNDEDYLRMDSPAVNCQQLPNFRGRQHGPWFSHVHRGPTGSNHGVVKLDSRFIQDVKIFDGTVMAPLTPFTKIWRMRNNGPVAWPQNTQLVWIGGDKLTDTHSVELKIPAAGVLMDQELDVAVDFISPQLPGRYISYWRMASPDGPKFGQRIWVLIHVDTSKNETPQDSFGNLNLNLPPASSSSLTVPEMIGVDPAPGVVASPPKVGSWKEVVESSLRNTENELKIPINYSLLVGNGAGYSSAGPSSSLPGLYHPILDLTDKESTFSVLPHISLLQQTYPMPQPVSPFVTRTPFSPPVLPASTAKRVTMPPSPPPPVPATAPVASAPKPDTQLPENDLERLLMEHPENYLLDEKLILELEEMGFKQVGLNKEVQRMNEYDMGMAVDDLCDVGKWDPVIEEQLEEMDFHDTEMNKQLLKKNNGSIKRVVMDLIAGEEA